MYEKFRMANPTFQSRIEAFTSEGMKLSQVFEEVNKRIVRKVSINAVGAQLKKLEDGEEVERVRRGYYVRV